MSVLIKGMEMPEEGYRQVFITSDGKAIYFPSTPQNGEEQYEVIPDADMRPIVRGEWIQVVRKNFYDEEYRLTRCTACGYEMNNKVFFEPWDFHFCPNCGAKMEV